MTLNITVVSREGIYQSSDFRLADFKVGPDGQWIPIEDNSPKLITLQYRNWAGYLTYCGIGRWDHVPTYAGAAQWILSLGHDPTFDEVASVIERKGSDWLGQIQNRLAKFQAHTFVLAAYEMGAPRVAIISNTHSAMGSIRRSVDTGLQASFGADAGTHVYVTGLDNTVSKEERLLLKRLVKNQVAAKVIRNELARINARAADCILARNGISRSCMCYSIDNLGGGGGEIYGNVVGRLLPIQISNGLDLTKMVEQFLSLGMSVQLRGVSFATSASSNAVVAGHIDCSLHFNRKVNAVIGYDLSDMNERHVEIASANEQGSIVGQLRRPVTAPPNGVSLDKRGRHIGPWNLWGLYEQRHGHQ